MLVDEVSCCLALPVPVPASSSFEVTVMLILLSTVVQRWVLLFDASLSEWSQQSMAEEVKESEAALQHEIGLLDKVKDPSNVSEGLTPAKHKDKQGTRENASKVALFYLVVIELILGP